MMQTRSISAAARKLSILLFLTFIGTVALTAIAFSQIRLGGGLDRQNQQTSDFIADVLPPSLYLVEPMLQATLIASDPEEVDARADELTKLERGYRERLQHWTDSDLDPALRQHLQDQLEPVGNEFWTQVKTGLIPAGRTGDPAKINVEHDRLEGIYQRHRQVVDVIVAAANRHAQVLHESSSAISAWSLGGLALAALILCGQLLWTLSLLRRNVLAPLGETARTMTAMADGNLQVGTGAAQRDDEIGEMTRAIEVFRASAVRQVSDAQQQQRVVEALSGALGQLAGGKLDVAIRQPFAPEYESLRTAFNTTVDRLGSLIREVAGSAQTVSGGATEILSASDDLALRNERQAGSVEETAAAMRQVTASVAATAEKTVSVRETIGKAHHEVTAGSETVHRTVVAMSEIETSSHEINQIVAVIEGIAFQTNLLALNAGVEAARAGDAGKGFAVVANEVRALAQRSTDAAREISELIGKSSARVSEGVSLVAETGELLQVMVSRITSINDSVAEIAGAAQEQASNLDQVNGSVGDMDRVTQQNAAMVEQTTAAARSLSQEANRLADLVARFSTDTGATARATPRPSVAAATAPPPIRTLPPVRLATSGNAALASPDEADWAEF